MTKITKYLEEEFRGQSESMRCMEDCGQPWKRFLVATYLLWKVEKKILLFGSYGKTYLRLIEKMKRSLEELLDENVSWHEYGAHGLFLERTPSDLIEETYILDRVTLFFTSCRFSIHLPIFAVERFY